MPSQEGVVVRHARREDVPVILHLIQQLARYHDNGVSEATEESLLRTIAFAPSPDAVTGKVTQSTEDAISPSRPARALLLFTPSGVAVGLALYFYSFSTWRARPGIFLEDLFVSETERGSGYGGRLLAELAQMVLDMEGGRLDWVVMNWNKSSIDFYERCGARGLTDQQIMRVDGEKLVELAKRAR